MLAPFSGPWLVCTTKVYPGLGADIVMESITLTSRSGGVSSQRIIGLLLSPPPAALGLAPPLNAAHIDPVSKWLAGLVVRAQTKNIAVRIFEVHFARTPRIVGWRMAHACSLGEQLLVQRVDITHSDPHPASWIALIAHGQKEMTHAARNRSKRIAVIVPPIHLEAEHADVVVEA